MVLVVLVVVLVVLVVVLVVLVVVLVVLVVVLVVLVLVVLMVVLVILVSVVLICGHGEICFWRVLGFRKSSGRTAEPPPATPELPTGHRTTRTIRTQSLLLEGGLGFS